LKKLSEEKELTGEKKFCDPFNFVSRAMPIMLCNNIPSLSDLSDGMTRRLMVFKFERKFRGAKQDKGLFLWRDNLGENGAAIWIGGGGRSEVMIRVWRGDAQVLF